MAQFYTVSNSMRAKDKDGNPKVWDSGQYGTFEVWNMYMENDDTKYQVNKKPGFEGFKKGQQVYGTTTKGQYGGRFKQEQVPEGMERPAPKQSAPTTVESSSVQEIIRETVDYLKALVDNLPNFPEQDTAAAQDDAPSSEDVDEPVDLSQLDF